MKFCVEHEGSVHNPTPLNRAQIVFGHPKQSRSNRVREAGRIGEVGPPLRDGPTSLLPYSRRRRSTEKQLLTAAESAPGIRALT